MATYRDLGLERIPGSARRFYDPDTGKEYSRRQVDNMVRAETAAESLGYEDRFEAGFGDGLTAREFEADRQRAIEEEFQRRKEEGEFDGNYKQFIFDMMEMWEFDDWNDVDWDEVFS